MLSVRRPRARRRKRRRPLRWTPVSPPRRSGRRNQQRTAKTEEEALAAAAAASNMADASRAAQLGDPRRRPARPLVTGPRGPERPRGNHRASAGQSVASRRSRSARPGAARALPPPRALQTRERALRPRGARRPALGGPCKALLRGMPKCPRNATSLGNNVHVSVVSE
uniref:translation initiation factor IF-2-like n=1 Tax=Halichoerus grypus TaxID=9711 RepID=UPI001658D710|nr:translation initiation factor IF-2-like [Halichoerus grypus]